MTDETGTDIQPSDVVNVEEFLFGGVTEETADDDTAEVADELPAGDVAGHTGDLETTEDSDGDPDTAAEEPDDADAAEEQPRPTETEATEDLKVVLSVRSNRATIGVQQPSADPHIESFDYTDLFELAYQLPAVVARAKARWEEEPMHPAYVKPAPAPRQRNRRRQGMAQAATAEGEVEQPQQPETLRLF